MEAMIHVGAIIAPLLPAFQLHDATALQADDGRFNDQYSTAFQTRRDSVRVNNHRQRKLLVQFSIITHHLVVMTAG